MSLLGSLVDAGVGIYNNERNLAFQQAAIDQNMALTRESWARDDNAIQRRVADLKAAGLNPILAAGSAAGNSNPIRVEPKRSDFKTDFGSSSLADDIGAVQQIKHNKLANQSAALQNAILEEQKEGYRLDNEKKQLEINHYGETPIVKFVSVILSHLTGKSFTEWLDVLLGRSTEDSSSGSSTSPVSPKGKVAQLQHKVEDFAIEFVQGKYFYSDRGVLAFNEEGQKRIDDFYNANLRGIISYEEFLKSVYQACSKVSLFGTTGAAGSGYAGGGGSAW